MRVLIGVDPHKGSHTAVAIGPAGEPLGRQWVRACPDQARQLLGIPRGPSTWCARRSQQMRISHLLPLVPAAEPRSDARVVDDETVGVEKDVRGEVVTRRIESHHTLVRGTRLEMGVALRGRMYREVGDRYPGHEEIHRPAGVVQPVAEHRHGIEEWRKPEIDIPRSRE